MNSQNKISLFQFNSKKKCWEIHNKKPITSLSSLKIVTYNVWFDSLALDFRAIQLLRIIEKTDADIICLQEVTNNFVKIIMDTPLMREKYLISSMIGGWYGVMIITKIPFTKMHVIPLPTFMDRSGFVGEMTLNGETINICTVHLESLDAAQTRAKQLEIINSDLSTIPHALILGDFNFDSSRNYIDIGPLENDNLAKVVPEFIDIWAILHPHDIGFTFDSQVNSVITKYEQMRYDRIILKSKDKKWIPTSIEILGNTPFKIRDVIDLKDSIQNKSSLVPPLKEYQKLDPNMSLFASDHFGLVTVLQWKS